MKRLICCFLSFTILLSSAIFSFAENIGIYCPLKVEKVSESVLPDGTFIEKLNIDGKPYTFTHKETDTERVIIITGAENAVIRSQKDSYKVSLFSLDNPSINGEISFKGSSKANLFSFKGNRVYMKPVEQTVSWVAGTSIAMIAAAIAGAVGGPVGYFISAAAVLFGQSVGCRVVTDGYYEFKGTHVHCEMTSKVYKDKEHIATVSWGGTR